MDGDSTGSVNIHTAGKVKDHMHGRRSQAGRWTLKMKLVQLYIIHDITYVSV